MLNENGNVENLRGRVVGPDGKPCSHADILLYAMFSDDIHFDLRPHMSLSRTDSGGGFSLEIPPGIKSVRLRARDGAHATCNALALTLPVNNITLQLDENASISLAGIVQSEDGETMAGAALEWFMHEVGRGFGYPARIQESDGRFLIGNLWPDLSYGVEIYADGYELHGLQISAVSPGEVYDLGVVLLKKAWNHVSGQVLDERGMPVANAIVTVAGLRTHEKRQCSDSHGRFHITGVGLGSIDINIVHGGRSAWLRVKAGGADVTLILK